MTPTEAEAKATGTGSAKEQFRETIEELSLLYNYGTEIEREALLRWMNLLAKNQP